MTTASAHEPYLELFDRLLTNAVDPSAFAEEFLRAYLADPTPWDQEVFAVLDSVFADADAYEPDDELRAQVIDAIDGETLRKAVRRARAQLAPPGTSPVGKTRAR